jgi:hypothetical protein
MEELPARAKQGAQNKREKKTTIRTGIPQTRPWAHAAILRKLVY